MNQQMRRIILTVATTVFLSACASVSNAPTSTPPEHSLLRQIDEAERKWQEQEIESYRIEVLAVRGTWHAQSHQITVRSGKAVEASATCNPAPAELGKCEVEPFNAEDYTVPALFALARIRAQRGQGQRTRITFDPSYGFPNLIASDSPEITDGGEVWRVMAFEALE
ncbi:MAG: DUF6174 domain-containing protein [Nitrospiria bacterium]